MKPVRRPLGEPGKVQRRKMNVVPTSAATGDKTFDGTEVTETEELTSIVFVQ